MDMRRTIDINDIGINIRNRYVVCTSFYSTAYTRTGENVGGADIFSCKIEFILILYSIWNYISTGFYNIRREMYENRYIVYARFLYFILPRTTENTSETDISCTI